VKVEVNAETTEDGCEQRMVSGLKSGRASKQTEVMVEILASGVMTAA
jgi:hypothetical protein